MSGAQALAVLEPVCAALAAAHELGVVHRDVKASSVMVCRGAGGVRRVVLLDFGIAKPSDALATDHPDRQPGPSRSVCPSRQVTLPVTENVRSRR